ncbi:MAG TPA: sugar ABC transporter permease [Spirochaetia bacterium]|nr:sugar ABC transporter permease [Spirochaetia bacterium]
MRRNGIGKTHAGDTGFLALCLLPGLLLYGFFMLYPAVRVFGASLFEWSGTSDTMRFVGLDNFKYLFTDKNALKSLANTGLLMLMVPVPTLALSLFFAAVLSRPDIPERVFYRVVFFFPSIISFVVVAILWSFIYHPTMGLLDYLLKGIGLGGIEVPLLGNEKTVLPAIAVILIWQAFGYYMVMYIAGMDAIPQDIYEAAELDGASKTRQFFCITLPLLWELIRTTLIFSMNGVIVISFTVVNILTAGGPNWASDVALTNMYRQAFGNANFGYAMSIAVVVFIVSVFLSVLSRRIGRDNNDL